MTDLKDLQKGLVLILIRMGVIDEKFTGQVTLHFNEGGLSDIDKYQKSLLKKKLIKTL